MFSFRALSMTLRRWGQTLRSLIRPIQRGTQTLIFRLWDWGRSRNWIYFLQGLPALAISVFAMAVVVFRMSISAEELQARYLDKAQTTFRAAKTATDFSMVMICYERLASMGQERPDYLYEMGVAHGMLGEEGKAFQIMNQLAPLNKEGGLGRAHHWLAVYYLNNFNKDPQKRKTIETHLKQAIQATDTLNRDEDHGFLGSLYLQNFQISRNKDDLVLAEKNFEKAIRSLPEYRLRYVPVLKQLGKLELAQDQLKSANNTFKDQVLQDPSHKRSRIHLAVTLQMAENFDEALKVLAEGLNDNYDPQFYSATADAYFNWYAYVLNKEPDNFPKQFNLLEKGLQYDPTNQKLLSILSATFASKAKDADAQKSQQELMDKVQKILVQGKALGASHFLIGMLAWHQGDEKKALIHWEQAYTLNPTAPTIANNLAFILAYQPEPDLPRALKIIQLVIKTHPDELTFRETRGAIHMKMKSWKEALSDFEWVLRHASDFPFVHKNLSIVYRELGDLDMERLHREKQEEIDVKAKVQAK